MPPEMPPQSTHDAKFLSLKEIAAWQLPEVAQLTTDTMAALPSLQRGAVWRPHQVECLWDSLVRGFPIGAFLLAPFECNRGKQPFKFQQEQSPALNRNPEFHLLDGQQRANAIALGFLNPWDSKQSKTPAALWVDLSPTPEASDTRFLFRVLTKSHPWGYRRDNAAYRIHNKQMLEAMDAFSCASPNLKDKRPAQIPLECVWPYDAVAPIPVALILEAVQKTDPVAALRDMLKQLPLWNDELQKNPQWQWARKVDTALDGSDPRLAKHLNDLLRGLSACLQEKSIPALVLRTVSDPTDPGKNGTGSDSVETLFIRVNTKGTKLDGEELIYSLLKSSWPDAHNCVEKLQFKIIPAPRLVLLTTRLVLASSGDYEKSPPPTPNVSGFRKLLSDDSFKERILEFIQDPCKGRRIFETAKNLLEGGEYGLPFVLSCGIARSQPDVLFMLLRWVDRMLTEHKEPCAMDDRDKRRIIGMVTAFAWFAANSEQCVNRVWKRLQSCAVEELNGFFSHSTFMETLRLDTNDSFPMLPLISPKVLADFINTRVTGSPDFDAGGARWTTAWKWGERMQPDALPEDVTAWYRRSFEGFWKRPPREDGTEFDLSSASSRTWRDLVGRLADWRRRQDLLIYAQRGLIRDYFPDYDPSLPDQMEDINCPWDYDHVLAQNYVAGRHNIPQIIKDWHGTMGNFRAWPFDINRSDGDATPQDKFRDINDMERERYGLCSPEQKRQLSFIADNLDWTLWQKSTPSGCSDGKYLSSEENVVFRQSLIRAVTTRFVAIYREWYDNVGIADLLPENTNSSSPGKTN
jgi:hypothetical protein